MPVPVFTTGEVLTAANMNQVGLWLVKTQTVGTAVSSVQVTGAFSSSYDSYKITWTGGTSSAATQIDMTLGSTTTAYYNTLQYGNTYTTPTPTGLGNNNGSKFTFVGWSESSSGGVIECELHQPFLSKWTHFRSSWMATTNGGMNAGVQQSTTSFTSFTFTPLSGTLTGGTIRVYGYRN